LGTMGCLVPLGRNGCVGCVGCVLPLTLGAMSLLGLVGLGWRHGHSAAARPAAVRVSGGSGQSDMVSAVSAGGGQGLVGVPLIGDEQVLVLGAAEGAEDGQQQAGVVGFQPPGREGAGEGVGQSLRLLGLPHSDRAKGDNAVADAVVVVGAVRVGWPLAALVAGAEVGDPVAAPGS